MKRLKFGASGQCASKAAFWEADPASEPMSTLDAEFNNLGAQLAMFGGNAANRDG